VCKERERYGGVLTHAIMLSVYLANLHFLAQLKFILKAELKDIFASNRILRNPGCICAEKYYQGAVNALHCIKSLSVYRDVLTAAKLFA
jgi:hypothetical protein